MCLLSTFFNWLHFKRVKVECMNYCVGIKSFSTYFIQKNCRQWPCFKSIPSEKGKLVVEYHVPANERNTSQFLNFAFVFLTVVSASVLR